MPSTPPGREPKETGKTTQRRGEESEPRLPHERDESSDAHATEPRRVIRQGQKDLERGLVDTDRGPVLDEAYQRQKR